MVDRTRWTRPKPQIDPKEYGRLQPYTQRRLQKAGIWPTHEELVRAGVAPASVPRPPGFPERMEALDHVRAALVSEDDPQPFKDHYVFAAQHLLASEVPLLEMLEELGVAPEGMHIAGTPYSANHEVERYLRSRGYSVCTNRQAISDEDFDLHRAATIREELEHALNHAAAAGKKLLILDDGGHAAVALKELIAQRPDLADLVTIVEQTTRGLKIARELGLPVPIIDVARSEGKQLEAQWIGRKLAESLLEEWTGLGIKDTRGLPVTVVGYGWVGRELVKHLLELGCRVTVVDDDPDALAEVPPGVATSLRLADVAADTRCLVGVTGTPAISLDDLKKLPPGAIVASGSSAEVELPMIALRQQGVATEPFRQGEGKTEEFVLDGKPLWVLKGGRPVNFDPERLFSVPPELIQHTRGLMLIGALQAVRAKKPGVVPLARGARFARAQKSLIKLMSKRWAALNLSPLRAPTPAAPPRPGPPPPELGNLSAVQDLNATLASVAQFRVSLRLPPPSAEQLAQLRALNALRDQWKAYLSHRPLAVPREERSLDLAECVYRDEAGILNYVSLGYGPGAFRPVPLAGVEGEPIRLVRHTDAGFFEPIAQTPNGLRSHFFEQQAEMVPEEGLRQSRIEGTIRPIATHPAGRTLVHDKRLFVWNDDGKTLSCTELGAAQPRARFQVPAGAGATLWLRADRHGLYSVFGAEQAQGLRGVTAFSDRPTMFRVTQDPPTVCGVAGDLETQVVMSLGAWMRRCRTAFPMGNEWMIMDGETAEGRGILLAVHLPSRQVYGAQHDPDEEVDHMASSKRSSSEAGWLGVVRKRHASGTTSSRRTLKLRLL